VSVYTLPTKSSEPKRVTLGVELHLTPAQREVYNMMIKYTKSDLALRTHLIGIFIAYGAERVLVELRQKFPKASFELPAVVL